MSHWRSGGSAGRERASKVEEMGPSKRSKELPRVGWKESRVVTLRRPPRAAGGPKRRWSYWSPWRRPASSMVGVSEGAKVGDSQKTVAGELPGLKLPAKTTLPLKGPLPE